MSDQNEWPMGTWDAPLWTVVPGFKRASRMECLKLAFSLKNVSFLMRRLALKQFVTG
jgi:hypothetical protein